MICDSCWGYDAVLHPCLCEEPFEEEWDAAGTPLRPDPIWWLRDRFRGLATQAACTAGNPVGRRFSSP